MVTEHEVQHIAKLADIGINTEELGTFTAQFNAILDYFDTLDTVKGEGTGTSELFNVLREDEPGETLGSDEALCNACETADGCFSVPKTVE